MRISFLLKRALVLLSTTNRLSPPWTISNSTCEMECFNSHRIDSTENGWLQLQMVRHRHARHGRHTHKLHVCAGFVTALFSPSKIDNSTVLVQFHDNHRAFFDRLRLDFHTIKREHLFSFGGPKLDFLFRQTGIDELACYESVCPGLFLCFPWWSMTKFSSFSHNFTSSPTAASAGACFMGMVYWPTGVLT